MMNPISKHAAAAVMAVLAGLFLCGELGAQSMPSFFKSRSNSRKRTDAPTVVEAATMDIDIENNVATLLGNVVVDDQDVKITCDKMVILLEDKQPEETAQKDAQAEKTAEKPEKDTGFSAGEAAPAESGEDDPTAGKQLKQIECFGEVVITHRADPADKNAKDQVATSDYAIYDLKAGTITLTGRPVLTSGTDRLDAQRITVEVETGRTRITDGKGTYYGDTPISSDSKKKNAK